MSLIPLSDAPLLPDPLPVGPASYDLLDRLHKESPVWRGPHGMALALRARHVETLVSDATRQLETEAKMLQGIFDGPIFDFVANAMLYANGDAHRRRRQPIARTFAFKLMAAMRPRAAAIAEELVNGKLGIGPFDFVGGVAAQMPARIIAEIMGIEACELPLFMGWIADASAAIGAVDPMRRPAIERSLRDFNAFVDDLLAQRRANPRDDFLTEYVQTTAQSGELSEEEIRAQIVGLIFAGSDTTRNATCMILHQLLRHPDQWAALRADPDGLKRAAVEEGLRYEPIVASIPRVAVRDIELDGYLVPAGAVVAVSILSVLRDPEIYSSPNAFDIHRQDRPRWSFAFGAGPHRCAGEALARIELEEMIAAIARSAHAVRVVSDPPVLLPGAIRAVSGMIVEFW